MLRTAIPEKMNSIRKLREQVSGVEDCIAPAKRYADIQELTPKPLPAVVSP